MFKKVFMLLAVIIVTIMQLAVDGKCVEPMAYYLNCAANYAETYWNRVCHDGYYYTNTGAKKLTPGSVVSDEDNENGRDCAHFVSCAIGRHNKPAGGVRVQWTPAEYRAGGKIYGIPNATNLYNWITQQSIGELLGINYGAGDETLMHKLTPGDLIFYDFLPNDDINHVAIYAGKGRIYAHSNRQDYEWYDLNPYRKKYYVRMHCGGDVSATHIQYPCGDGFLDLFDILTEGDLILEVDHPSTCQRPRADLYTGTPPYCSLMMGISIYVIFWL